MQHSQLIRSDDDSGTSTDVLDVFSYDATDKSLDSTSEPDCTNDLDDNSSNDLILGDEEEHELSMQYTTSMRLSALMFHVSNRDATA